MRAAKVYRKKEWRIWSNGSIMKKNFVSLNREDSMTYRQNREKKRIYAIVVTCLLLVGGMLFLTAMFTVRTQNLLLVSDSVMQWHGKGKVSYDGREEEIQTLPYQVKGNEGDVLVFTTVLEKLPIACDTIMFRSVHQKVRVYLDGEEVNSFGYNDPTLFGRTPGSVWHMIDVPEDYAGMELRIETETIYSQYGRSMQSIYMGTQAALAFAVIKQAGGAFAGGIPVLVIGIALMFMGFLFADNWDAFRKLYYLGIFAILAAVWMLLEARMVQLFSGRPILYMYLIFIAFSLLPVVLTAFLMTYPAFAKSRYIRSVFWISVLNFACVHLLQITNVKDYLETTFGTHLMFILLILGIIWIYIKGRRQWKRHDNTIFIAAAVFALFGAADIFRFYFLPDSTDALLCTRIGIAFFILILGCSATRQISRDRGKAIEERTFKKLAYTDMMTGLPNRTAFEERMDQIRTGKETPIVGMVDVNNLKKINDTWGHKSGDDAICRVGEALIQGLGSHADVYRIGGDEFCVLMTGKNDKEAEKLFSDVKSAVCEQDKVTEYPLSVAFGFVVTGEEGIDKAFIEADRTMYACKKAIKEQENGKTS